MKFHENMIFLFEPLKKNPQARGQCYQMPKNTGNKKCQDKNIGLGAPFGRSFMDFKNYLSIFT